MKFELHERFFRFGNHGEASTVCVPSGTYNIRINTVTKVATKQLGIKSNCDVSGLVGPIVLLEAGFIGGVRICGDIIITCIDMGYDLGDKEDCKKIKHDKELIKERYNELLNEKPELFDTSKIDLSNRVAAQSVDSSAIETGWFYRELNTSGVCGFCKEWKEEDPNLAELAESFGYTANGNIYNDMVGDDIYIRPEGDKRDVHTYHLFNEKKVTFLGMVPKKAGNVQICDDCDEVIRFIHGVNKMFSYISLKDDDTSKMSKVADYKEFTHDIFSPPSSEIKDTIYSKFKVIPEIIDDFGKQQRAEKDEIVNLLREKGTKITVTDIATMLRKKNRDIVERICKTLYDDGEIDFAGNNRYYIMDESQKVAPSESSAAPAVPTNDVQTELKKYKDLLDQGLIDEDDYNAKKKELLGL